MELRPPRPGSDEIAALRALCESVYQATDARRDAILAHDWSSLPRVGRALDALQRPISPAAIADAAWRLIHEAVEALEPSFPPIPGSVNPVEVVRWHVLERQPWLSLEAQLREEGRPVSRGTLIRRQHEFLPYLREWAAGEPAGPPSGETIPAGPRASVEALPPPRVRRMRVPLTVAAAATLLVAVGWLAVGSGELRGSNSAATPRRMIPAELEGRPIRSFDSARKHALALPDLDLPEFEGPITIAMALESEPGHPRILLSHRSAAGGAAPFYLWDPLARTMVWASSYWPPPEQRLTHAGVGDEVLQESYRVTEMAHAGRFGDLGRHAALVLTQTYSPTFVIFVDLTDGSVLGSYVHPGQFYTSIVVDLEGDGRHELVLGGTDNAVDRAVVAKLIPSPGTRAASTVQWNHSGLEQAEGRVLLPDWEEARFAVRSEQLSVPFLGEGDFDPHARTLSVGVGDGKLGPPQMNSVFHVRLRPDLSAHPVNPVLRWGADEVLIRSLGLELPDLTGWESRIEVAPRDSTQLRHAPRIAPITANDTVR